MTSDLAQLGALLFVAALVAMLTRRIRMPYTVGLVLAGMGLAFLPVTPSLHLSKDLIFYVFLPPLVFEAAINIRWRELRTDLPVLAVLAILGVVVATAVTACGLYVGFHWDWPSALAFGVLSAATDPVSVLALFEEAGVHGRTRMLIEAESLLNDGTAAVAFVTVLGVMAGSAHGVASISVDLVATIGGGVLVGGAVGYGLLLLAGRTPDHLVELTLTTLAAYGSFFAAERCHFSGVLATLTAGILIGNYGTTHILTEQGQRAVNTFWQFVAFITNSLVFILIGLQEAHQHLRGLVLLALAAIGLVMSGRALAIYSLCAPFAGTRLRVSWQQQNILVWGGLRGALALALALALPAALPHREEIITITFAVVAFSIFVQGLTMRPLLRHLGEIRNPPAS